MSDSVPGWNGLRTVGGNRAGLPIDNWQATDGMMELCVQIFLGTDFCGKGWSRVSLLG